MCIYVVAGEGHHPTEPMHRLLIIHELCITFIMTNVVETVWSLVAFILR